MKAVYICSPFKGNVRENIKKAIKWSRKAYKKGYLPICVHIYLEEATNERRRKRLLKLGLEILKRCDELWVCSKKISEGMKGEIEFALKNGIKIKWL